MEAAADVDGEGKQSFRFRWCSDAARYAVASVVTILIVAVVVKAVMVLRQPPLYLSVLSAEGGSALFSWNASQPEELSFNLFIRLKNPSGHVQIYYNNMTVYIFGKDTSPWSSNPEDDSMFHILLAGSRETRLPPQEDSFTSKFLILRKSGVQMEPSDFDEVELKPSDFDVLSRATRTGIVTELMLRMDVRLSTRPISVSDPDTPGRWRSFFCRPLLAGGNLETSLGIQFKDYVFCISGHTPGRT